MTTYVTPTGRAAPPAPPANSPRDSTLTTRRNVGLVGDRSSTYENLYRSQPWIFTIVNKLARGIGRLPAKTFLVDEDTESHERTRTTPYATLWRRPAPGWSKRAYTEAIVGSTAIFGNALAGKIRAEVGGPPTSLVPLDWRGVTPYGPRFGPVRYWRYRPLDSDRSIVLLPEDVVHYRFWGADGPIGISPLEPLAITLAAEDAARRAVVSTFTNGSRPAGALVTEQELDPDERLELKAEIQTAYEGADNWARVLLLDGGLRWESFSHTAQEAQTIEHRKLNREEACAVYDMPPPAVQILDRATFSNITEQHKQLYMDTYGPWLGLLEGEADEQLAADELAFAGEHLEYDMSGVLRADLKDRADAYNKLAATYTINEIRALENKPRIDSPLADCVWVPMNLQAVGAGTPPADPIAIANAIQKLYLGVGKVIDAVEARTIANQLGANLVLPGPDFTPDEPGIGQADAATIGKLLSILEGDDRLRGVHNGA